MVSNNLGIGNIGNHIWEFTEQAKSIDHWEETFKISMFRNTKRDSYRCHITTFCNDTIIMISTLFRPEFIDYALNICSTNVCSFSTWTSRCTSRFKLLMELLIDVRFKQWKRKFLYRVHVLMPGHSSSSLSFVLQNFLSIGTYSFLQYWFKLFYFSAFQR